MKFYIITGYPAITKYERMAFIMNKSVINAETMKELFGIFTDEMLADKIAYEDYLPQFREETGVTKNSPYEFMYRGFIGGLYIAYQANSND